MSITGLFFLFCAIHLEGKSLESVVGFVKPISLASAEFHIGGPWWSLTLMWTSMHSSFPCFV